MGPWNHGGWYGPVSACRACNLAIRPAFGTGAKVEAPFFAFYLKDRGPLDLPEALVFEGGSNSLAAFRRLATEEHDAQ